MAPRKLEKRDIFAWSDIQYLIRNNDLSNYNTFLVLNGGTGVGKTSSVMNKVQQELQDKLHKPQSMLVVQSRTATVNQINLSYNDMIEKFNGIDVCQRLAFMHKINNNDVNYDWVVIDECHGLFSEASFAQDAEFIASWIRSGRREKTHIIFVTANDEYFEELSRKYFPGNFNFIYLFPDFTHYVSNTYVKEIQFIKTNRVDNVLSVLTQKLKGKKGIIFLKRASDVKNWFFKLLASNIQAGMIVSQANETEAMLTTMQKKQAQNAAINLSNGQAGLTMADLCELYDTVRAQQGKEGIRFAVDHERLPDDIDILLATDTIQEGVSIKSHIDYIIIEGFTEVEVRQKLGRFRGNLELLYLIFNPISARCQILDKLEIFKKLQEYETMGNQTALAEFYGTQRAAKASTIFVKKQIVPNTQLPVYHVNMPAYYNCINQYNLYTKLINSTEQTVIEMYSYPLLLGAPKILNYTQDIKVANIKEQVIAIAERWKGIPLKGKAQEQFVQNFIDSNITDSNRRLVDTFRKCCNQLTLFNIQVVEKQATKSDLQAWPQFLTKPREKFKTII